MGREKNFCCVTTRGRNVRVLNGLGRDFGSLAALFLGLSVAGLDRGDLAASGLAASCLPAADFPLALWFLAVALVPASRLVLASATFAQADPWARSPPSGQTVVWLRNVRGAHGSGHSRGKSSGRMLIAFSSSAIKTRTRRRRASLSSSREQDGERNGLTRRVGNQTKVLPSKRSSSREQGRREKRTDAPRWEPDEGAAVEAIESAAKSEIGPTDLRDMAYGWGKVVSRRAYGEEGPGLDIDFDSIESLAVEIGQAVIKGAIEETLKTQLKLLGDHQPCPTCARDCPVDTAPRTIQVRGGTIRYKEPACHCPACRRDFFPSAPQLAARLAQLLPGDHR